jgi:riboflavin kinase / FMN adenylyltransferase
MPVIKTIEEIQRQFPNPVLTIGNFDGVHLGHRALFDLVKQRAAQINGTSMVMTFEPHPLRVLKNEQGPPLITLHEQKIELIQDAGIDVVICLTFTSQFAAMEPEDFIKKLLVQHIGVKELVIGYDYTFGRKARGNREMLIRMGNDFGFNVHTVGALPGPDGQITSSTHIRELIQTGQVENAPAFLGRFYRIAGRVIQGKNRGGKLLGFPTANIRLVDELVPKTGVYAVRVGFQGRAFDGVANIGYNPTFSDVGLSVEVHCFDFNENIYGEKIQVDFIARIRDEKRFSGPDDLAEQIKHDCQYARRILSNLNGYTITDGVFNKPLSIAR